MKWKGTKVIGSLITLLQGIYPVTNEGISLWRNFFFIHETAVLGMAFGCCVWLSALHLGPASWHGCTTHLLRTAAQVQPPRAVRFLGADRSVDGGARVTVHYLQTQCYSSKPRGINGFLCGRAYCLLILRFPSRRIWESPPVSSL